MASLIRSTSTTSEDAVLYGNPKMTYFKKVFMKKRNYTAQYLKLTKKTEHIHFGNKNITIQIPNAGDLLGGIYLDFKLKNLERIDNYTDIDLTVDTTKQSRFTSYVNGIGYNIIDKVELYISGTKIQTLTGELIYLLNELHSDHNKSQHFYTMTNYYNDFTIGTANTAGRTNNKYVRCQLPIPFFFSKDPGQYLPLCNLEDVMIELKISLNTFDECTVRKYNTVPDGVLAAGLNGYKNNNGTLTSNGTVPSKEAKYIEPLQNITVDSSNTSTINAGINMIESLDVFTRVIYLEPEESTFFKSKSTLQYLVDIFHIGLPHEIENPNADTTYTAIIDSNHPTKYLYWILQRKDVYDDHHYQNYTSEHSVQYGNGSTEPDTTKHLLNTIKVKLDSIPLFEDIDPIIISNIMKYDHFKGPSNESLYIYNASFNPDDTEPSGSVNYSNYRNKIFEYTLSPDAIQTLNSNNTSSNNTILFRYYVAYFNIFNVITGSGANLIYT
jgi:hypothetical protein